jgi:hypothetical protein
MKSVIYTLIAATALWIGGAFTSTADAQYRYYRGGYYGAPRYYRSYNYAPRYYSNGYYTPYRTYYRSAYPTYPTYYRQPYYYGGYYGSPYYSGYYAPGVSFQVGPVGVRTRF